MTAEQARAAARTLATDPRLNNPAFATEYVTLEKGIAIALLRAFADGLERGKVYNNTAYWLQKVDAEIAAVRIRADKMERECVSESLANLPRCGLCGEAVRQFDVYYQNGHVHEECYAKVEREVVAHAGDGRSGAEARPTDGSTVQPREGAEGSLRDAGAVSRAREPNA